MKNQAIQPLTCQEEIEEVGRGGGGGGEAAEEVYKEIVRQDIEEIGFCGEFAACSWPLGANHLEEFRDYMR